MANMDKVFEHYLDLTNSLRVSVKIGHDEVARIVVEDLIKKRNSPTNKKTDEFDAVLRYYLTEDEFVKYVLKNEPID